MSRYLLSYDLHTEPRNYGRRKEALVRKLTENGFQVEDIQVASTFVLIKNEVEGDVNKVFGNLFEGTGISCVVAEIDGDPFVRGLLDGELAVDTVDFADRLDAIQ